MSAEPTPAAFPVRGYSLAARLLALALQALGALGFVLLAAGELADVVQGEVRFTPLVVARGLLLFCALPFGLAALLGRRARGELRIEPTRLHLALRRVGFEVPLESIAEVLAWRVPLPGAGLRLRLRSGRVFEYRLQIDDPAPLCAALAAVLPSAKIESEHFGVRFGQARAARKRTRLWLKYGLFPLLLTAPLFRLHQFIEYGGLLGEYYLLGLRAYLTSLAIDWLSVLANLVLFAGLLRGLAEGAAFLATVLRPSRAQTARTWAERACSLGYYLGIPALIALRVLG